MSTDRVHERVYGWTPKGMMLIPMDARVIGDTYVHADDYTRPNPSPATPDEAALKSSHAVHMNMMLGHISKLTPAQVAHLYSDAECAEIVSEIKRQRPEATPDEQTMGKALELWSAWKKSPLKNVMATKESIDRWDEFNRYMNALLEPKPSEVKP